MKACDIVFHIVREEMGVEKEVVRKTTSFETAKAICKIQKQLSDAIFFPPIDTFFVRYFAPHGVWIDVRVLDEETS